jgi:hypothetical protein
VVRGGRLNAHPGSYGGPTIDIRLSASRQVDPSPPLVLLTSPYCEMTWWRGRRIGVSTSRVFWAGLGWAGLGWPFEGRCRCITRTTNEKEQVKKTVTSQSVTLDKHRSSASGLRAPSAGSWDTASWLPRMTCRDSPYRILSTICRSSMTAWLQDDSHALQISCFM